MEDSQPRPVGSKLTSYLLVIAAALVGAAGLGVYVAIHRQAQAHSAILHQINVDYFNRVKGGNDGANVVSHDPELVEMLAADPVCVANLKTLYFAEIDFAEPGYAVARKLVNVNCLGMVSCRNSDRLLAAIKGMPSLEEIFFETSLLSDEGVAILASFPNLKKVHFEQVVSDAQEQLLKATLPSIELEIPFPERNEPGL
jgi:hypothetical protein